MKLSYETHMELEAHGFDPDWLECHMMQWVAGYSRVAPERIIPLMTRWIESQEPSDLLDALARGWPFIARSAEIEA